jgi:hypothetical protein
VALADLIPAENRSPGLTASELDRAQEEAGAAFPPDLAELLTDCLPFGRRFPDWRNDAAAAMNRWRDHVLGGFLFDVEECGDWPEVWGAKPADPREVRARVVEILDDAPRLIPIYAHRGIPNEPLEAGNPVFSVWQMDIIVYGNNLERYLHNEFAGRPVPPSFDTSKLSSDGPLREIRFWKDAPTFWD